MLGSQAVLWLIKMRASEIQPSKLVIFDIDDTLVHTQTKVHVIRDGRTVRSLNSHDFTHYKLKPGESFDFGDFQDAREFFTNARPIIPLMNQLKKDIATGNKVVMVTARSDFNDRELFLDTFRKYGVDMSRVHVYRAGNIKQKIQTEEKKKIIIRHLLDQAPYTKAIMYDDAVPNLQSFVELKQEYPNTKFYAWHVSPEGEATEYHRTNESAMSEGSDNKPQTVTRVDSHLIKDFAADMQTYYHTDDWSESGQFPDGATIPKRFTKKVQGVYAGDPTFTALYATGNSEETRYVAKYGPGQPIVWFDKKDLPSMRDKKSYLTVFDASNFKKVPSGEYFSSDPGKPIEQQQITDPLQYIKNQGWVIRVTDDLPAVLNKLKAQDFRYGAEGMGSLQENFADGKKPGRKGLAKRVGVNCKQSVSKLRSIAANSSGERQRMAHWCANMKSGRSKK